MLIFLNGCSSSGKSTIIKALQYKADSPWLSVGIDAFWEMMPKNYIMNGPRSQEGFSYVSGSDAQGPKMEVKNGPFGIRVIHTIAQVIKTMGENELDIVVDEVILEQSILEGYIAALKNQKVYFVWVACDLKTLEEREILRGNRGPGLARTQFEIVSKLDWPYDLTVISAEKSPFDCAQQILNFVRDNPNPTSFKALAQRWKL